MEDGVSEESLRLLMMHLGTKGVKLVKQIRDADSGVGVSEYSYKIIYF